MCNQAPDERLSGSSLTPITSSRAVTTALSSRFAFAAAPFDAGWTAMCVSVKSTRCDGCFLPPRQNVSESSAMTFAAV